MQTMRSLRGATETLSCFAHQRGGRRRNHSGRRIAAVQEFAVSSNLCGLASWARDYGKRPRARGKMKTAIRDSAQGHQSHRRSAQSHVRV